MMIHRFKSIILIALLANPIVHAADKLTITVSHELAIARPSETITVAWSEINKALPGALIQKIAVKDATGRVLPHQVTNVAPLAKDPLNIGIAYGELLFQYSFGYGEKSAMFSVEKTDTLAPPFPSKVSARLIPERLDDFAWENDKIAHRTYGPALGAPAVPGSGKEVLISSGLDVWFKRVPYPIVDRWYNKGHDHYHKDEGEGMDMYNVGKSRGAGGTGIWHDGTLYTSNNFTSIKILANGPVRAVFELSYANWDAGGTQVSEVKRFTVDAGNYFDQVDSTFTFTGQPHLTVAVGLNKTPSDKRQDPAIKLMQNSSDSSLGQWIEQASNGAMGTAIVLPGSVGNAEDPLNQLILANVTSGKPIRYYTGAVWSGSGEISSIEKWQTLVATTAARANNPIRVKILPSN